MQTEVCTESFDIVIFIKINWRQICKTSTAWNIHPMVTLSNGCEECEGWVINKQCVSCAPLSDGTCHTKCHRDWMFSFKHEMSSLHFIQVHMANFIQADRDRLTEGVWYRLTETVEYSLTCVIYFKVWWNTYWLT